MPKRFMDVMFCDEAPRIGCGRRIVEVVKEGRLWTYVRVPGGQRARIAAKLFARLPQKEVKVRRRFRKSYSESRTNAN